MRRKIGDRVKVICRLSSEYGEFGTIVADDGFYYSVETDNPMRDFPEALKAKFSECLKPKILLTESQLG